MTITGNMRGAAQSRSSVLVVDDDTTLLEELAATLVEEGFSILRASSGVAALELLGHTPTIGVLITDIRMPDLDGLQLIETLSAQLPIAACRPQIVVLTGHGTMNDAVRALRLHASDFLRKPVSRADLVSAARTAMDKWLNAREQSARQVNIQRRYTGTQNALTRLAATLNGLPAEGSLAQTMMAEEAAVLPAQPPNNSERIRSMLREQRMRTRFFRNGIPVDPSWDMLLELMLAHVEDRQIHLTDLSIASGLAIATVFRRVEQLVLIGLVQREDDPADRRRVILKLTESGVEHLLAYLEQVACE